MIARNEQKTENTWDLSALVKDEAQWDREMKKLSNFTRRSAAAAASLIMIDLSNNRHKYLKKRCN